MDDKLTTEDAIMVLRNLQDWLYLSSINGGTRIQREAIDVAIDALNSCSKVPNSSDCISRQAAIDYFVTNVGFHDEDGYPIEDECELREIWTGYFDGIPSAEPERPRGRWIPVDSYSAFGGDEATWMAHGNPVAFYYCSECKGQAYAGEDGESLLTDYCPNCGSKMEGVSNES